MSLVLNTNDGGGGGYVLTNEFIDSYPDAKNSILMLPDIGTGINAIAIPSGSTISSLPTQFNVNGTPVNFLSQKICFPEYFTGCNGGEYGIGSTADLRIAYNCSFRYGLDTPLKGGEIIGKKIIFGNCGIGYEQNLPTNGNVNWMQTVKLLHTDGTLTSVGTYTFSLKPNEAYIGVYTYSQYAHIAMPKSIFTATVSRQGVVAQAGDYVVIDCSFGVTTTLNYSVGLGIGYIYSPNPSHRASLTQISID